ncbi:MAG TPA: ATP-dependent RecD-like DNA helicase [Phycisphaerales bacterium]|nr:ATP-dependent RecD-like DNA helicase [Phycisphaerales bacterium]
MPHQQSQHATPTPPDQIAGLVERVTFHNDESGFCVLRIKARGHRDLVTVVGTLPEVRAGEWLEAQGAWTIDKEYGQQFRAEILRTLPPSTVEGIEKYLASGMIKGIGPVLAGRIVNVYKERTFEIIDADPHSLTYVDGIGPTRKKKITEAWAEQKAIREIMVFLHGHKVSTSRAFRIFKAYGNEAIEKVRQDPYRLARDIQGIGFKTADVIAESVGIGKQSDLRARAGVEYVLLQLTEEGHCGYGREELVAMAVNLLEIPSEIIQTAVEYLRQEGRIVARILDSDAGGCPAIFLAGLDQAEKNLAESLIARQAGKHPCPQIDVEKALAWVEGKTGLQLAVQQRQAIQLACRSKVLVITGGPGVGKTTIINSIVKILRAKRLKVLMAAPTGRAAKRMAEATGCEAKTIHRLLVFDPRTHQFKHNAEHPLEGDAFIIDETSMLDITLAWQLVRAIPYSAAVILVGDVDQLPSVGPGCVLRDIIDSGKVPVCRLTKVFRQAARSAIVTNAHRVNQGQMPSFPREKVESPGSTDFYFVEVADPDKAVDMVRRLVCEHIPAKFGFDRVDDIQVLSPMQRGVLGCRNLNTVLQEALNPTGAAIQRYGWTFRGGDKVMQMVNDYDKDVFNGDIGRVTKIDEVEQEVVVRFDDRPVKYDFNELDELHLSYATTVHKSQGSEYPVVVLPIHTQHYMMLQRNLLYTAITRSRKLVVLVGTLKALAIATKNMDARRRVTLLGQRLEALDAGQPGRIE